MPRFSLKANILSWARVLTKLFPAVLFRAASVSPFPVSLLEEAFSLLIFLVSESELSQGSVLASHLIHGEFITVSLLRVRVFGVARAIALTNGDLAVDLVLVFELSDQGGVGNGLFSSSLRSGYKLSLTQTAGLEHCNPESCKLHQKMSHNYNNISQVNTHPRVAKLIRSCGSR